MERGPFERPSERVARKGGARWGALGARLWDLGALSAIGLAALAIASNRADRFGKSGTLLNVSYDATRKAYDDLDAAFANDHEARHGQSVAITLSHGGSSAQARKV